MLQCLGNPAKYQLTRHLSEKKQDFPSWFLCLNPDFCRKAHSAAGKHTPLAQMLRSHWLPQQWGELRPFGLLFPRHTPVRCNSPASSLRHLPATTSSPRKAARKAWLFYRHRACCGGCFLEGAFVGWPKVIHIKTTARLSHQQLAAYVAGHQHRSHLCTQGRAIGQQSTLSKGQFGWGPTFPSHSVLKGEEHWSKPRHGGQM